MRKTKRFREVSLEEYYDFIWSHATFDVVDSRFRISEKKEKIFAEALDDLRSQGKLLRSKDARPLLMRMI